MSIVGRYYSDPGDRLSGRHDPPRRCRVLIQWRTGGGQDDGAVVWLRPPKGAPRNVAVEYEDGSRAVIAFPRRLRKVPQASAVSGNVCPVDDMADRSAGKS